MSEPIETVGSMLPKEIERCAKLVQIYKGLPNGVGEFGAAAIQARLDYAQHTIASQDVVGMIQALQILQGCE